MCYCGKSLRLWTFQTQAEILALVIVDTTGLTPSIHLFFWLYYSIEPGTFCIPIRMVSQKYHLLTFLNMTVLINIDKPPIRNLVISNLSLAFSLMWLVSHNWISLMVVVVYWHLIELSSLFLGLTTFKCLWLAVRLVFRHSFSPPWPCMVVTSFFNIYGVQVVLIRAFSLHCESG